MKVLEQFRDLDRTQKSLGFIPYIGTACKNGINAYKASTSAFAGNTDIAFGRTVPDQGIRHFKWGF